MQLDRVNSYAFKAFVTDGGRSALYIALTRKFGQDQDHGDGPRPKDVRLWVIGLGILSAIVVFIFVAEIITRL